jgi:hypothetical protein
MIIAQISLDLETTIFITSTEPCRTKCAHEFETSEPVTTRPLISKYTLTKKIMKL